MSSQHFYDTLAPLYHLIYEDWNRAIAEQSDALGEIIAKQWGGKIKTILDATAGIGTQSIGLAARGFDVTSSDLSPAAIARCKSESQSRQVNIKSSVGDVRSLSTQVAGPFDLVISCDNSLPHLEPTAQLPRALAEMFKVTRAGGGILVSVRDYAKENLTGVQEQPYGLRLSAGRKYQVMQVREHLADRYEMTLCIVEYPEKSAPRFHRARSVYFPITIDQLMQMMKSVGFHNVQRIDGKYFQPVIVADKP